MSYLCDLLCAWRFNLLPLLLTLHGHFSRDQRTVNCPMQIRILLRFTPGFIKTIGIHLRGWSIHKITPVRSLERSPIILADVYLGLVIFSFGGRRRRCGSLWSKNSRNFSRIIVFSRSYWGLNIVIRAKVYLVISWIWIMTYLITISEERSTGTISYI